MAKIISVERICGKCFQEGKLTPLIEEITEKNIKFHCHISTQAER